MKTWDDISVGKNYDVAKSGNDPWTLETKRMIHEGYAKFFKRRGMVPPKVSKDKLSYEWIVDDLISDDHNERKAVSPHKSEFYEE